MNNRALAYAATGHPAAARMVLRSRIGDARLQR
jgi:hypothetical protein